MHVYLCCNTTMLDLLRFFLFIFKWAVDKTYQSSIVCRLLILMCVFLVVVSQNKEKRSQVRCFVDVFLMMLFNTFFYADT